MIYKRDTSRFVRMMTKWFHRRYLRTGETFMASRHNQATHYLPKRPFEQQNIAGLDVYSLHRKNTSVHILYLHGGAYVKSGDSLHTMFLKRLSKQANVSIHYIEYPLAPTSKVRDVTEQTVDTIQSIQSKREGSIWIMGDSAGGGLALAIAPQLQGIQGYILLSPWLDVSMSNPHLRDDTCTDGFFTTKELRDCGHQYAEEETSFPLASPLYQTSCPHDTIHIFTGTKDILHFDIIQYETQFPSVHVYQYRDAAHVFPLLPFSKEQKDVIHLVKDLVKSR